MSETTDGAIAASWDTACDTLSITKRMRSRLVQLRIDAETLDSYLSLVTNRNDLHGIMNAAADLRELHAQIETLEWALRGESE